MTAAAMLEVHELEAAYGSLRVLHGVSLAVQPGRVAAILGRNGAGKSTLLKSVVGQLRPRRGRIVLEGRDITRLQPYRIARAGIAYVPETRDIFPSLTVAENLDIARAGARPGPWTMESVLELFPRLAQRLHFGGTRLSGGEQQMLAIARALLQNPKLLVLDEPTEGLAPVVIDTIRQCLLQLKETRVAMLLVEQNSRFAAGLADRMYVLGKGEVRWEGTAGELGEERQVLSGWVGV